MSQTQGLSIHLRLKLLRVITEFMILSGLSEEDISESFEKALAGFRRRHLNSGAKSGERQMGNLYLLSELLRLWHSDDRFIDDDANPKPLPLDRGSNSLRAAIKKLDQKVDPKEIMRTMITLRLIRRGPGGRYLPTTRSAIIRELHPVAIEHVAKTVIHLVSTACRNTDPSGQALSLIERHAYVPDLNPADRKAFADFTRVQGMAYLESVDDWLQRHRARQTPSSRSSKRKGMAASVHLVAYLGDEAGAAAEAPSVHTSRPGRIKPPPEARA